MLRRTGRPTSWVAALFCHFLAITTAPGCGDDATHGVGAPDALTETGDSSHEPDTVCPSDQLYLADGCAVDPCLGVACSEHGTCALTGVVEGVPAALCACDPGFVPEAQELACVPATAADPCEPNPCLEPSRGVCVRAGTTAICRCDPGTVPDAEDTCVVRPPDPCDPSPCLAPHRGVCLVADGATRCACDAGYEEDPSGNCATPVDDPCEPNPCQTFGRRACVGTPDGDFACTCSDGHVDVAGACVLPDPCDPNPCTDTYRTVCVAQGGLAACACDDGYELSGDACVLLDACDPNPCREPHRGVCTRGAFDTAICGCDPGYVDLGGGCEPRDPCADNPCREPHRGVCTATDSTAVCGCDAGFIDENGACVPELEPGCGPARPDGDAYENDDCAASASRLDLTTTVSQPHTIDIPGDVDWFRVTCADRETLTLTVTGLDTYETIYEADGVTSVRVTDSQSLRYRCVLGRDLLVKIRHYDADETGAYTAVFGILPDDLPDALVGAAPITLGVARSFALEGPGDIDSLTWSAASSHTYEITVTGADTRTVVADPQGAQLFDTDFQIRRVAAPMDGAYTLRLRMYDAAAFDDSVSVLVRDLGPDDHDDDTSADPTPLPTDGTVTSFALAAPGDRDAFRFACTLDHTYEIEVEGADTRMELYAVDGTRLFDTDNQVRRHLSAATGICYLVVRLYDSAASDDDVVVTVRDLGLDDHGDDPATGLVLSALAAPTSFALAAPGDVDAFRFGVIAHHAYRVSVSAADTRTRVYDPSGTLVVDTDNQTYDFLPEVEGVWGLTVRLYDASGWDDTVVVSVTDRGLDTHGWSPATATPMAFDVATNGAFEVSGDLDWFSFSSAAGSIVRIVGTNADLAYTLYRGDGVSSIATLASDTSYLELSESGPLFLRVREQTDTARSYTLTVSALPPDDTGDTAADTTATLFLDASPTAARFDLPGDIDVFAIALGPGEAYAVETSGPATLVRVYTESGVKLVTGTTPTTFFTSGPAGLHYVHVQHGSTTGVGDYTVRVRR